VNSLQEPDYPILAIPESVAGWFWHGSPGRKECTRFARTTEQGRWHSLASTWGGLQAKSASQSPPVSTGSLKERRRAIESPKVGHPSVREAAFWMLPSSTSYVAINR